MPYVSLLPHNFTCSYVCTLVVHYSSCCVRTSIKTSNFTSHHHTLHHIITVTLVSQHRILLPQQNDETVGEKCHPNQEVGEWQPVPCTANLSHPAIITIE